MVEGYGVKNLDLAKETEIKFKIRDFNYLSGSLSVSLQRLRRFLISKIQLWQHQAFSPIFSYHKHDFCVLARISTISMSFAFLRQNSLNRWEVTENGISLIM